METVEVIDYAHPAMMAEHALKDLHKAMLNKEFDAAIDAGVRAIAEVRLAISAVRHAQEQLRT